MKQWKAGTTVVWLAVAVAVFMAPVAAFAETDSPEAALDAAFLSNYIWRGYQLSKDSLVIQPSATVAWKGFSVNLWGNLDTDVADLKDGQKGPYSGDAKWTETDLTVAYDHSFGIFSLGVGYIYYALDSAADTQEFYASGSLDVLLAPTLTIYRDVDEFNTWYFNFGISHSFALPREISLDLGGSVGYYTDLDEFTDNLAATGDTFNGFHDALFSAALNIPVGRFTIAPTVAYSLPLSDKAENNIRAVNAYSYSSKYLFGGVVISFAF